MGNSFKILIVFWLVILTIISMAALCRTFYHDVVLTVDYAGILVGLLAALCTVLIGWQLYNIIDFDKRKSEFYEKMQVLNDMLQAQSTEIEKRIELERREARINTAYLGHLLLMIVGRKRERIIIDSFKRINGIETSNQLIRQMSYQAIKGTLPRLLKSQKDFHLQLKEFQPQHFDEVLKMALEEYSETQDEADNHILVLVNELKRQCYP